MTIKEQFQELNDRIINRIIAGNYTDAEYDFKKNIIVSVGGIRTSLWIREDCEEAQPWGYLMKDIDIHLVAGRDYQKQMYEALIDDYKRVRSEYKDKEIKKMEEKLAELKVE